METLILTFDTIALMVAIYFSYRSEKAPKEPELGPFRIRVDMPDVPSEAKRTNSMGTRRGR